MPTKPQVVTCLDNMDRQFAQVPKVRSNVGTQSLGFTPSILLRSLDRELLVRMSYSFLNPNVFPTLAHLRCAIGSGLCSDPCFSTQIPCLPQPSLLAWT